MTPRPIEDLIEDATRIGGQVPPGTPNPHPPESPEGKAWQAAYDRAHPPFDIVAYAAEMGAFYATRGAGFSNPYAIGTPERRAWQEAYDRTPKGVPKMSGPQGRSEGEHIRDVQAAPEYPGPASTPMPDKLPEVEFAQHVSERVRRMANTPPPSVPPAQRVFDPNDRSTWSDMQQMRYSEVLPEIKPGLPKEPHPVFERVVIDDPNQPTGPGPSYPYSQMMAEAEEKGRRARLVGKPFESNPYDHPELRLKGPAGMWAKGWRECDARMKVDKAKLMQVLDEATMQRKAAAGEVMILPQQWETLQLAPTVTHVALKALPACLAYSDSHEESIAGDSDDFAVTTAFHVGELFVAEFKRRQANGQPV